MLRILLLVPLISILSYTQDQKANSQASEIEELKYKNPVAYWDAKSNLYSQKEIVTSAVGTMIVQRKRFEDGVKQYEFGQKICFPQLMLFYAPKIKLASDAYTSALNAGSYTQEQLDRLKAKHNFLKSSLAELSGVVMLPPLSASICGRYVDSKDKTASTKAIKKINELLEDDYHRREKDFEESFELSKMVEQEDKDSQKVKEEIEKEVQKIIKE